MKHILQTPATDGFSMPGEFEPHHGCIMIWPERPGSWPNQAVAARAAFKRVMEAIAESEHLYVAAGKNCLDSAREALCHIPGVEVFEAETDDAWARDIAPVFVCNKNPDSNREDDGKEHQSVRAVNWEFNAWGGEVDGLYASWEKDNAFARFFSEKYGYELYDAAPFVLEGGSVHSDGEGTLLVTECCLLSPGRNPALSREQIEEKLCAYLGACKVIWIPEGIYQDETNGHIDNICAFLRPGEVVLAWTDNEQDEQYALSAACYQALSQERDARGRKLIIHKLPVPDVPIRVREEDLSGFEFEEGEEQREAGERLAASYVNFYFSNNGVILPVFGGENEASDRRAIKIMEKLCPERKVIPVYARDILAGGGNIHCITQQIPKGSRKEGRT